MARRKGAGSGAGYNFATGEVDTNPPPTVDNPDFSKMTPLKPMAAHDTMKSGGRKLKRAPVQRSLTSGGR